MNRNVINIITHLKKDLQTFCYYNIQQLNLSTGLAPFLIYIGDNEKASPSDIVKSLCMDPAHVARSIIKLEKLGLVQRLKNEKADKRKKVYTLTDSGIIAYNSVVEDMTKWENEKLSSLDEKEKQTLILLLNKLKI